MSSACSAWRSSAATEHDTEQLSQSTTIANIIFINIDWKMSRHINPACTDKNLGILAKTTSSIVTNMKPAVICCCEVGTAMSPMTVEEMSVMMQAMREAWEEAATEHPAISFHLRYGMPTSANVRTSGFWKMSTMCKVIGVRHKPFYAQCQETPMKKASTS